MQAETTRHLRPPSITTKKITSSIQVNAKQPDIVSLFANLITGQSSPMPPQKPQRKPQQPPPKAVSRAQSTTSKASATKQNSQLSRQTSSSKLQGDLARKMMHQKQNVQKRYKELQEKFDKLFVKYEKTKGLYRQLKEKYMRLKDSKLEKANAMDNSILGSEVGDMESMPEVNILGPYPVSSIKYQESYQPADLSSIMLMSADKNEKWLDQPTPRRNPYNQFSAEILKLQKQNQSLNKKVSDVQRKNDKLVAEVQKLKSTLFTKQADLQKCYSLLTQSNTKLLSVKQLMAGVSELEWKPQSGEYKQQSPQCDRKGKQKSTEQSDKQSGHVRFDFAKIKRSDTGQP